MVKLRYLKQLLVPAISLAVFIYGQQLFAQEQDSLVYPFQDNSTGGLFLDDQITYDVDYNPETAMYILRPMIGNLPVGAPTFLTQDQYLDLIQKEQIKTVYRDKSREYDKAYKERNDEDNNGLSNLLPSLEIKSKIFETIFGGNKIELIPQGSAAFDLGVLLQKIDNPQLLPQNRENFTIDLQQRIQMSLLGKVGENLNLRLNYDTQAGFAFENRLNLAWRPNAKGGEDNIVQNIEFGNISMPLNTQLIQGAQSLFGVRTDLKFGNTNVSAVFSQQQSESRNIVVQGNGLVNTYKIFAENYEYNKHFFLGQYFRNRYNTALQNYPLINSRTNITRIEVWRIDRSAGNQQQRRSILAVRDIAEIGAAAPENNDLYNNITNLGGIRNVSTARNLMNGYNDAVNGQTFQDGEHFVINENARRLDPSEYTFNAQLGYISLNQPMVDGEDLLAVSIQYTDNGQVKKIGEMSDEEDQLIITKLIKPNNAVNTTSPMWDLMMKNVYSLNALNITPEDFMLNVLFKDLGENASGAINYLPGTNIQDQTLLQVTGMDRLDQNGNESQSNNAFGDGLFDYLPNLTINPQNGAIYFTKVEPFGEDLRNQITDPALQDKYVFQEMYDQIPGQVLGERLSQRYSLEGRYKGETGSGIPLGAFNVPQGSVRVTANGQELTEGIDYTVDYQLGRVNIINQQIADSGVPINIQLENQATFNLQRKRFLGLNVEHKYSDNLIVGGTLLNYQERPLTQKALYGAEPVNNTIVGANVQYNGQSDYITRLVNKIPGIKTDQTSQINFTAEAAYLLPGQNNATNGESYIDDFEDSQTKISLMDQFSWRMGSTPGSPAGLNGPHPLFPNGELNNDTRFNNGRRLMSWYTIDPRFYGIGGNSSISDAALSTHQARRVELRELFDQRDVIAGTQNYLSTLDLTFYPDQRGPYNVNPNANDTDAWASMMRPLNVANFVDANIEYVEFWMMDPYSDGAGSNGKLLLQIGNVSEDILKDGELQYENGLPSANNPNAQVTTSNWGTQPDNYPIVYAFDTTGAERRQQDVGFDGLNDTDETSLFGITETNPITNETDPAADNYVFYLDGRWDNNPLGNSVAGRYRYFRNPENNSPEASLEASSQQPDSEDANNDYNLDQTELYTQYTVNLSQAELSNPNNPYIVARKEVDVTFENGQAGNTTWYQFRVPVDEFDLDLDGDGTQDITTPDQLRSVLTSARYMRLVMQGFTQQTTLRFGSFDLVRSDWRRYPSNIAPDLGLDEGTQDVDISNLEIGIVNIEANSNSQPPYVIPPGIQREQLQGTTGFQAQNEASMVLQAELNALQARAVFRNVNLDLRRYKKLDMFVHAEDLNNIASSELDENTKLFIRMGSDYSDNYYEYEISLKYTPRTATAINDIWPEENLISMLTEMLVDAKIKRDSDGFVTNNRYEFLPDDTDTNKKIFVKGRPSLGNITSLMIGVRNVERASKNILVWVNELRMSEIENEGGYAATANLGLNLGDFAQINAVGTYNSVGFGAIDAGPSLRAQEELKEYSINAQVQLDKFLPEKWGVQLPLNVTFREQFIDPKFNPLDNDVEFDKAPNREQLKDIVRTYTKSQSFGFSNIRKIKKSGSKQRFYDIENISLSFLYADDYYRDIYTTYNIRRTLRASANYNYSFKNKFIQPFKDWHMVQDTARSAEYLKWVKEFNFNLLPSRLSFRTDISRTYNQQQFRDLNQFLGGNSVQFNPVFSSNFLFSWQYNVGFDLTKSLKLDYTSATTTLNDSPEFLVEDRGLVWNNLFSVGRPVNYDQSLRLNWRTPLNLLPYLHWTNMEVGFQSNYNWQAAPAYIAQNQNLGNTAQNSNSINVIGNLNFTELYRGMSAFKKLDSIKIGRKREIDSLNQAYEKLANLKRKRRSKNKSYQFKHKFKAKDYLLIAASSIKQANINYTQTNGAVLPGLIGEPGFFGTGGSGQPGLGFIFGTEFDIKSRAVQNGWVTNSDLLLEPFQLAKTTNFTYNVQIEPMEKLRIDLTGARNSTFQRFQSNFNLTDIDPSTAGFQESFAEEIATINNTIFSFSTAFTDPDQLYQDFKNNTQIISQRLGTTNAQSTGLGTDGYYDGYGVGNVDVLIPAFLATLQGENASNSKLGYKRNFPLPNWRLSYTGLIDKPFFAKRLSSIEITHAYTSTYTANGVQSNINFYNSSLNPTISNRDNNNNFYAQNLYGGITVAEAFAPLVGVDMTFRNNLQIRAQYNRDRILSLSLSNYTLNEDYGNEIIAGLGYVFKDLKMKMRFRGKKKTIKGDLNIRTDLRIRDNETRLRRLLEDDSQVIGGQRLFSLRVNADYDLSKNFNLRFFYEQDITEYKISTAFPISTTRAGISATFTFGN